MKIVWVCIFTVVAIRCAAQQRTLFAKGDSLIIQDESLSFDPFALGRDPLAYLTSKIKPQPTVQKHVQQNLGLPTEMDTIFDVAFGADVFHIIYRWDIGKAVINAVITTPQFTTKHGLKTGQNKAEVIARLSQYGVRAIPRYLVFESPNFVPYLKLEFRGDMLQRIEFGGWTD